MNYVPRFSHKNYNKYPLRQSFGVINQKQPSVVILPEYYHKNIELPQKSLLEETKQLLAVEKESLNNVLSMFKDVLLCDGKGWCTDKWYVDKKII
uniref:Uncharacterized protein n=1 Tax=Parastrongyloides trichosuri TaxID=131310 RepID=A0A0N4Z4T9_PARTI